MADSPPTDKEVALKARIIPHMNKDHAEDLQLYLQAYAGLSGRASASPQLHDISLGHLEIQSVSGTHSIVITPPMTSLAESRARLVEMSQHSIAKLGLSDVQIASYVPPEPLGWLVIAGVSFYFACWGTLGLVRPETAMWRFLDAVFPFGGATSFRWTVRQIFPLVLAIHVAEAWWMGKSRLGMHRMRTGSGAWWLWLVNTFFEGATTFKRFDKLVKGERKRKEAQKH